MNSLTKILPIALVVIFAGCATSKVDWNSRINHFNYEQAVLELGPPDKSAKLTDGTIVAEWLTRRGYQTYSPPVVFIDPYDAYYGPIGPHVTSSYSPDSFLRLTFAPDGQLRSWKKFSK